MSNEYAASLSQFQFGDMLVEYLLATESQAVGLSHGSGFFGR